MLGLALLVGWSEADADGDTEEGEPAGGRRETSRGFIHKYFARLGGGGLRSPSPVSVSDAEPTARLSS